MVEGLGGSEPADAIDVDGEADSAGEEAAGGLKVVGAAWAGTEGRELDGVAALGWLGRAVAMVEVLGCGSAPTSLAGSGSRKALRKPMSDWLKPGPVDAIDVDGEADGAGEAEFSVEEAERAAARGRPNSAQRMAWTPRTKTRRPRFGGIRRTLRQHRQQRERRGGNGKGPDPAAIGDVNARMIAQPHHATLYQRQPALSRSRPCAAPSTTSNSTEDLRWCPGPVCMSSLRRSAPSA